MMKKEQLQTIQPKLFKEFQHILQEERLSHAYVFSGSLASFEMAKLVAKTRFCQHVEEGLPCENCRECRLIEAEEFSDVKVIRPSHQLIKTDTVREMMRRFSTSGFESMTQVFIIQDADKMHVNAANSLLKFIEDPQTEMYIFMLTQNEDNLLSTIKSRTQIVTFPYQLSYVVSQLENDGLLRSQATLIAKVTEDLNEAKKLGQDSSFLQLLTKADGFVQTLFEQENKAYLQIPSLVNSISDKAEANRLVDLLTVLVSQKIREEKARHYLEKLIAVRKMITANVSVQNALEYMVIR